MRTRYCRLMAAWVLMAAACATAAPHHPRIYPNASITILAITEGPDGFLWLAAQDGLYRFDGLHFQKIAGYPFASARCLGATADGSLWIGGGEGLVRYHKTFKIVLRDEVHSLVAFPDHVLVRLTNAIVRIGADGTRPFRDTKYGRQFLTPSSAGGVWLIADTAAVELEPAGLNILRSLAVPTDFDQAAMDSKGRLWAADPSRTVLLDSTGRVVQTFSRIASQKTKRAPPLVPGRNGELWFIGETIRGLVSGREFRSAALDDQYQPTAAYEDESGHLWVARLGLGLVEWTPDLRWERWFSDDFQREPVLSVLHAADGSLLAATHENIYRFASNGTWTRITEGNHRYEYVLPRANGGFYATLRDIGLVRLSAAGRITGVVPYPLVSARDDRKILQDSKRRLWVGNKLALLRLDRPSAALRVETLYPSSTKTIPQAVDLELDNASRLWVGYGGGLAWLDDQDNWHQLPTDRPVTDVRSFTVTDSEHQDIWVACRTHEWFFRLHKQGNLWHATRFDVSTGYGPPDTDFIKRDSRGWIWRGASDGVHISDGVHTEPNDWLHISPKNGLATDSTEIYGFFEETDGSVWISGERGLTHLRPDPQWFDAPHGAPPPRITRIQVDDQEYSAASATLPIDAERILISVGSLETPVFRDAPFRYRLTPGPESWQFSKDGTIELRRPGRGSYALEVANTGLGAPAVLHYAFQVGTPILSWNRYWVLWIPFGGALLAWWFRSASAVERLRYRFDKTLFLLRRRFAWRKGISSSGEVSSLDRSGETLAGRYQLIRPVSRGGFSVVYEARDGDNGSRRVALKMLSYGAGNDGWLRERFAHEVAALNSVHHPGVVAILDSWIAPDGSPCLVMPFLVGPTLSAALEEGAFPAIRVARLARGIGAALAEIHSRGIVHRDLKPENIILACDPGEQERPVLIDFGIAGLKGTPDRPSTTTLLAGSFHYMAPERLVGHYSPASDVYAFGVILLEMLTGKRLSDMEVLSMDDGFAVELGRLVEPFVGVERAPELTACLVPAYAAKPGARPSDMLRWSEQLASLLESCQGRMRSAIQRVPKS